MEIVLYKTKSASNKLDKSLTDSKKMEGTLRNETNLLHPTIRIHTKELDGDMTKYNYARIKKFGRYYYAKVNPVRSYIWDLELHADPLYSFREQIRNCDAIVIKQEDDGNKKATVKTDMTNKMLNDGSYKVAVNRGTKIINFENGEDTSIMKSNNCYILTVITAEEVANNG